MEAAPEDLGRAPWQTAAAAVRIDGTRETIGSGRHNTQHIGERSRATLIVQQFSYGGFDDWFLPSKNELDLMFINLRSRGLGNFSDDWYWSSTDSTFGGWRSAWRQNFSNGAQQGGMVHNKEIPTLIRPIRKF